MDREVVRKRVEGFLALDLRTRVCDFSVRLQSCLAYFDLSRKKSVRRSLDSIGTQRIRNVRFPLFYLGEMCEKAFAPLHGKRDVRSALYQVRKSNMSKPFRFARATLFISLPYSLSRFRRILDSRYCLSPSHGICFISPCIPFFEYIYKKKGERKKKKNKRNLDWRRSFISKRMNPRFENKNSHKRIAPVFTTPLYGKNPRATNSRTILHRQARFHRSWTHFCDT